MKVPPVILLLVFSLATFARAGDQSPYINSGENNVTLHNHLMLISPVTDLVPVDVIPNGSCTITINIEEGGKDQSCTSRVKYKWDEQGRLTYFLMESQSAEMWFTYMGTDTIIRTTKSAMGFGETVFTLQNGLITHRKSESTVNGGMNLTARTAFNYEFVAKDSIAVKQWLTNQQGVPYLDSVMVKQQGTLVKMTQELGPAYYVYATPTAIEGDLVRSIWYLYEENRDHHLAYELKEIDGRYICKPMQPPCSSIKMNSPYIYIQQDDDNWAIAYGESLLPVGTAVVQYNRE